MLRLALSFAVLTALALPALTERIRKVCEDIVEHFQTKVEPNGFKGQIVTFDRESCLLFKAELDAGRLVSLVQQG